MLLKTVKLHGYLAGNFGKEFKLKVSSVSDTIKALSAIKRGFKESLLDKGIAGFHIVIDGTIRDKDELVDSRICSEISIVPVLAGSGAIGKIIVGAILIYLTVVTGGAIATALLEAGASPGFVGALAGFAGNMGVGLILGGIAQALYKPPKVEMGPKVEKESGRASYSYNGPVNTTAQGNIVPICYGELIIGSQVVSARLRSEQYGN